jgi:membrane protein implicated in regulation of membrane protease activity
MIKKNYFFISNLISFVFLLILWTNESMLKIEVDSFVFTLFYYSVVLFLPLSILMITLIHIIITKVAKKKISNQVKRNLVSSCVYALLFSIYVYWALVQDYG